MIRGVFQTRAAAGRTGFFIHEGLGPFPNRRTSVFFRMSFYESDKPVVARVHGLSVRHFHFHLIVGSVENNLNGIFVNFLQWSIYSSPGNLQNGSHLLIDPRIFVFTQGSYSPLLNALRIIWNYFLNVNLCHFTQTATVAASTVRTVEGKEIRFGFWKGDSRSWTHEVLRKMEEFLVVQFHNHYIAFAHFQSSLNGCL